MYNKKVDEIKELISEKEVIKIIKELVEIPSYPGIQSQETKVAEKIKHIFESENIKVEVQEVVDGRCNVIARIKGNGIGKNLLLTGHTDTVPPYDMENACKLIEKDNKLYGRGTVDMKGPLACMIASMIAIKRSKVELKGDLIFAGVIDEEEGSEGTIDLLKRNLDIDAAIVGEPTRLEICVAHRGLEWIEFDFVGKTVHGGKQEEGINAIVKATNFIQRIEDEVIPKIYSNTHPIIGTSSMNYGTINGGTQPSTVAGNCKLKIDRRWVPKENYQDMLKEYQDILDDMSKKDDKFKCEMKIMKESVMRDGYVHEAMETDTNSDIVKISKGITDKIMDKDTKLTYFPAWTDGGLLSSYANIETIVFAPGDLESAHSSKEFIDKKQVYPATVIYTLIAMEYCS
ncbi:M20 family metallopeptidase [Senegalia massiliensis]|uniref:Probable succinyl-diaminopimelate desuccinylase n=1 Tax=Senegalia massiliensis TaxID=1720316 RepID=A0A845QYU6_9CLOT|nr:M20 family metallopeptidase [Senegalia massiliensis]NBI07330.1 M20 family peptidase [Senegalia massiliensis]